MKTDIVLPRDYMIFIIWSSYISLFFYIIFEVFIKMEIRQSMIECVSYVSSNCNKYHVVVTGFETVQMIREEKEREGYADALCKYAHCTMHIKEE